MRKYLRTTLKIIAGLAILLAFVIGLLLFRFWPDENGRVIPPFESIDMAAYPPFAKAVGSSTGVQIFEGQPRSWGDDTETETRQTFKSHWYPFYSSPVAVSAADLSALRDLATTPSTFFEWRGAKLCGGYHPDWMIRWTASDGTDHELLLCFGCHEAKLYGPGYQLYCEIGEDGYNKLKAILDRYSSQLVR